MICSRPEWRDRALLNLRQKFLNQDYPSQLIDLQFQRVLQLNRADLIFRQRQNKKRNKKYKCSMVITYHQYNPPMAQWIQEELPILHLSKKCEELFPSIPVITRQSKNIAQTVIRSRHWKNQTANEMGGNEVLHKRNCVTCSRMAKVNKFTSQATKRTYSIKRKFSCETSWCIYLATCLVCKSDYVGQTWRKEGMRARHRGHRAECKTGNSALGLHFKNHHGGSTDSMQLVIIDSVAPGNHKELDEKEARWIQQLKTMEDMGHGGLNIREELTRGTRRSCTCGYC